MCFLVWLKAKSEEKLPGLEIPSSFFWANHKLFERKRANEWFAQKKQWFAHLLIYLEWPEQIAHSHSFVLSPLSDSLTVGHLSWAIWAIAHSRSFNLGDLSEWANSQPVDYRLKPETFLYDM